MLITINKKERIPWQIFALESSFDLYKEYPGEKDCMESEPVRLTLNSS